MMWQAAVCLLSVATIGYVAAHPRDAGLKILYHGKIFTSNRTEPLIEDGGVAVSGNVIVKVGSSQSVLQLQTRESELIDLEGKVLLPGFNDAHVHPYDVQTQ